MWRGEWSYRFKFLTQKCAKINKRIYDETIVMLNAKLFTIRIWNSSNENCFCFVNLRFITQTNLLWLLRMHITSIENTDSEGWIILIFWKFLTSLPWTPPPPRFVGVNFEWPSSMSQRCVDIFINDTERVCVRFRIRTQWYSWPWTNRSLPATVFDKQHVPYISHGMFVQLSRGFKCVNVFSVLVMNHYCMFLRVGTCTWPCLPDWERFCVCERVSECVTMFHVHCS